MAAVAVKSVLAVLLVVSCNVACSLAASHQQQQQQDTFTVEYTPGTREQVLTDAARRGWNILREYPRFNRLIISSAAAPADATVAAAAAAAPAGHHATVQMHLTALKSLEHVTSVERNGWVRRPVAVPAYDVDVPAQNPAPSAAAQNPDPGLSPDSASAEAAVCGLGDPSNPDAGMGINSEGTPYGIKLVQADAPEMQAIARDFKDNVLFCVIDTGLDITNQDFDPERTSGCIGPGTAGNVTTRESFKYCYNWSNDESGHGTHTSGTIAAKRNGRGVVGVSPEGAHLYHYNFFGPNDQEPVDLTVATWLECIDELERRKASTGNPNMKLVISQSFGVDYPNVFAQTAIKSLTAERKDVLWLASAGNSGDDTMGYPAGYPEIISIAAVDWNGVVAGFSTRNSAVDLAAPGVKTVSTIPLWKTAGGSDYYFIAAKDVVSTTPELPAVSEDASFFSRPATGRVSGSPAGIAAGPVVDCGLAANGASDCASGSGKICLIQRGQTTFCSKVSAAAAAGCSGVILFNSEERPECERFTGVDISTCPEGTPASGWPVVVTVSRKQGKALQQAAAAAGGLQARINVPSMAQQKEIGLAALSGTSMACPTAAGVAGLVWSAHTDCSAAEIRAALEQSAMKPTAAPDAAWTPEYGHGIVNALAAHNYLLAHPCSGR